MELQIKITGFVLLALGASHLLFRRYFDWDKELKRLSLINRQIMEVHTFFIGLMVFMIGVLCIVATGELIDTPLGKKISLGLGVFWLMRLFTQFFGYSPAVWRGKPFETVAHIVFSLLWTYLTILFAVAYFA